MSKYALFMSKMLTAKEVCLVSIEMRNLINNRKENDAVAMMLRQTRSKHRAYRNVSKKY